MLDQLRAYKGTDVRRSEQIIQSALQVLRPILSRIVNSFDNPAAVETKAFWNQIVQAKVKHSNVCGEPPLQYIVSGWILGFFYWDSTGNVVRFQQSSASLSVLQLRSGRWSLTMTNAQYAPGICTPRTGGSSG